MSKNDINYDQITSRLGHMSSSRSYDDSESDQAQDNQTMSIAFIAGVIGVFMLVAYLTFVFANGQSPIKVKTNWDDGSEAYFSQTDAACGKNWVEGGRNDKALMCYLTTKVERLCDPRERKRLARIVDRYRTDKLVFEAKIDAEGMAAGTVTQNSVPKDGSQFLERDVLVAAIRKVGALGYMTKSDYGWMADSLVRDAYKGQLQPPSACKS